MKKRQLIGPAILFTCVSSMAATSFTPQQTQDIQKIVHSYLVKNPQVLVEASQSLQAQMQQEAQNKAIQGIKKYKKQLFNDPMSPTAGNPNGNVQIVEFFDYQCGHCKAVAPVLKQLIKNDKNVKVIYKELPIFGGASEFAAKAALASVKQGKYSAFHNALFAAPDALNRQSVLNIAKKVGLNVNKISNAVNNNQYQQQIRQNFRLMQALGITGTPAFILANKAETKFQFIPGAADLKTLQAAVDAVN